MSTILDALKRLENETLARGVKKIPNALAGDGVIAGRPFSLGARVVVVGLAIVGVAAVSFLGYREWVRQEQNENLLRPDSLVERSTAVVPGTSALVPSNPGDSFGKGARTLQAGNDANSPKSLSEGNTKVGSVAPPPSISSGQLKRERTMPLAAKPKKHIEPPGSQHPTKSGVPSNRVSAGFPPQTDKAGTASEPRSATRANMAPPVTTPGEPVPEVFPPQPLPARDPYARAELFAKDSLLLQAISWSDLPSARITIINGRILHEGQSVDGFAVIQIRPQEVIVGQSGKHWKLLYDSH